MSQSQQRADGCAARLSGEDYAGSIAFLRLSRRVCALLVDPQSCEPVVQYTLSEIKRVIMEVTKAAQYQWHRLYLNSRVFFSRLLSLTLDPTGFGPLIMDYMLLVRSLWSRRQLGPKVVYPMQCVKERRPGPLVNLVLEHCRAVRRYHHIGEGVSPKGIDPPCVAVIDLDQVDHPIAQNEYSTRIDFYGHTCLLIVFQAVFALIMQALYPPDTGWLDYRHLTTCAMHSLVFFILAVSRGEGTLRLAWKASASTAPGCAVLLDQDFTVILMGSESALEAIAERSFSHPHYDHPPPDLNMSLPIYLLCQGLLFYPVLSLKQLMTKALLSFVIVIASNITGKLVYPESLQTRTTVTNERYELIIYIAFMLVMEISMLRVHPVKMIHLTPYAVFPSFLLLAKYNLRNYPIRTTKFLDALGRPQVRKWAFDTLPAAATFQCLVLCRGLARPVESVDVLAYLDMLIPDQRDVWKPWKERVADRIMHETDISFAPTVPTFGDARQVQLRDLLDEAQSGYTAYRRFYGGSDGGSAMETSTVHAGHLDGLSSDLERIFQHVCAMVMASMLLLAPSN